MFDSAFSFRCRLSQLELLRALLLSEGGIVLITAQPRLATVEQLGPILKEIKRLPMKFNSLDTSIVELMLSFASDIKSGRYIEV